jgi:molybdate transport system substrate-binding protein
MGHDVLGLAAVVLLAVVLWRAVARALRLPAAALVLAVSSAAAPAFEQQRGAEAPAVAAAADLKFALDEIAARYRADRGRDLRLVFGSSGNFARQIEQGAPFQLFLSADEGFVRRLAERGLTLDGGALYAVGRIVLFAPPGSPIDPARGLDGLREALTAEAVRRLAIANLEHAPYGRAAEEALRRHGLWEAIRPHLVLGENAAQATQFATVGGAQGGIVPYSLSLAPEVARLGRAALIPAEWDGPLRQRMVLLRNAGETARDFHAYLQERPAREVFARFGFVLPGE